MCRLWMSSTAVVAGEQLWVKQPISTLPTRVLSDNYLERSASNLPPASQSLADGVPVPCRQLARTRFAAGVWLECGNGRHATAQALSATMHLILTLDQWQYPSLRAAYHAQFAVQPLQQSSNRCPCSIQTVEFAS